MYLRFCIVFLSILSVAYAALEVIINDAQFDSLIKRLSPLGGAHTLSEAALFDAADKAITCENPTGECGCVNIKNKPALCYRRMKSTHVSRTPMISTGYGIQYDDGSIRNCMTGIDFLPTIMTNEKSEMVDEVVNTIKIASNLMIKNNRLFTLDIVAFDYTLESKISPDGSCQANCFRRKYTRVPYSTIRPTKLDLSSLSVMNAQTVDQMVNHISHSIFPYIDFSDKTKTDLIDPMLFVDYKNMMTQTGEFAQKTNPFMYRNDPIQNNILSNISRYVSYKDVEVEERTAVIRNTTLSVFGINPVNGNIYERRFAKPFPSVNKVAQTSQESESFRPKITISTLNPLFFEEWTYTDSLLPIYAMYNLEYYDAKYPGKLALNIDVPFYPFPGVINGHNVVDFPSMAKGEQPYQPLDLDKQFANMMANIATTSKNKICANSSLFGVSAPTVEGTYPPCAPYLFHTQSNIPSKFTHFDHSLSSIGLDVHHSNTKSKATFFFDDLAVVGGWHCQADTAGFNAAKNFEENIEIPNPAVYTFMSSASVSGDYKPYYAIENDNVVSAVNEVLRSLPPSTVTNTISSALSDIEIFFGKGWEIAGRVMEVYGTVVTSLEELKAIWTTGNDIYSILKDFFDFLGGFFPYQDVYERYQNRQYCVLPDGCDNPDYYKVL